MRTLTVDGRTVQVADDASLLDAARVAGVRIPTLCHHPAIEAWGGCRLCLVEITKDGWKGSSKLVTACLYPAENGLLIQTASEAVITARRVVLDLLLARCPATPFVQRLAREYGIESSSYRVNDTPTDCVLCGLCTRVCDHLGIAAIASASRGVGRDIAPPFRQPPPDCIGCLACAEICPTGHIRVETTATTRKIWGCEFEMQRCSRCGRAHVTRAQAAREVERHGVPAGDFDLCDACKRRQLAATMARLQAADGAPGSVR